MNKSRILGALSAVLFTFITISANAALVSRLDGDAAWDDELGITWLTNAGLSGSRSWQEQIDWIASLNAGSGHLGYTDWRLASMSVTAGTPNAGYQTSIDSCAAGALCLTNELGHMYYYNLGGTGNDLTGTQVVGDVTLTGVRSFYWSGTEFGISNAWKFNFIFGSQNFWNKLIPSDFGWAVRSGDVGAIPVPAALWLFGSGLLGLVAMARRKKA